MSLPPNGPYASNEFVPNNLVWAILSAVTVPILIALWFVLFGGLAVLGSLTNG